MYDGEMFEAASELWIKYLSQVSDSWPKTDARHNLASEVNNRLHQLDHILKRLHDACDTITASPSAAQQDVKQRIANRLRLANGEITHEEFIRGSLSLDPDPVSCMDAWDDVWIFTEPFYFFAWRMREVLNGAKPQYKFPGLGDVQALAIRNVRNQLIEHPENVKGDPNLTPGIAVMPSGPVLRCLVMVRSSDTGQFVPHPDGKDQGLFAAAEELREELERRFSDAIARTKK